MSVEYNRSLSARETIQRLLEHWQTLLEGMVQAPERAISQLRLLRPSEHEALLRLGQGAPGAESEPRCVHELFAEQVRRRPEAVALAGDEQQMSYAALERAATQLAQVLRAHGVGPEKLVGLCADRSPELVVGVLAILKAGEALPAAGCALARGTTARGVARCELPPRAGSAASAGADKVGKLPWLALEVRSWAGQRAEPVPGVVPVEHLAYVISTSGSTGQPKGVEVSHRGLGNLAHEQGLAFGLAAGSRELQFASWSFDASVSELLVALLNERRWYAGAGRDCAGAELLASLHRQAITHLTLPPSALAVLPESAVPHLETLVLAGEACRQELVERWGVGRRVINAYGPSEATVCASLGQCQPGEPLTLGQPLAQVRLYVLDAQQSRCQRA